MLPETPAGLEYCQKEMVDVISNKAETWSLTVARSLWCGVWVKTNVKRSSFSLHPPDSISFHYQSSFCSCLDLISSPLSENKKKAAERSMKSGLHNVSAVIFITAPLQKSDFLLFILSIFPSQCFIGLFCLWLSFFFLFLLTFSFLRCAVAHFLPWWWREKQPGKWKSKSTEQI